MSGNDSPPLVPALRFPDFQNAGPWTIAELGDLSHLVVERVGARECTPYTIKSGVGLISQEAKLGRIIAGDSLKNYVALKRDDFAYNKSATKADPQGLIAYYTGDDRAAVPNSIFTCFRVDQDLVVPLFLEKLFSFNLHGKWLKSRIAFGARANGSLQVDDRDLMAMPIPLPNDSRSLAEQQKIADCLSSLDELIAAESRKLEALKGYKKGLTQQLFPHEGATMPRLRFPEFQQADEWEPKTIGESCESFSGGTPSTTNKSFYGGEIPFIRSAEIDKEETQLSLTKEGLRSSAAKTVRAGDILVALYGANSGEVALAKLDGAINQAILCLRHETNNSFVHQYLAHRKAWIIATYIQGGQGNLSGEIVKAIRLFFPGPVEQQRIAEFLAFFDDRVTAQAQKIGALRAHKKALMQRLFPILEGHPA